MLPKYLTNLDTTRQQQQRQAYRTTSITPTATTTTTTTSSRRWCCTFPLVLLSLILVLHSNSSCAEKDFNFNDTQVPLLEPKDEPILIDQQISDSSSNDHHRHHHNNILLEQPYAQELTNCRAFDNKIILSLILKSKDWPDFNDRHKAKLLEKLSQFFAIPKKFITMDSITWEDANAMNRMPLKKGINLSDQQHSKLGRINFIIGCGTSYFTITAPIPKQIGQQVRDGALDNITGEEFGWWVIWIKPEKLKAVRYRRQVEGSGDDDEDDDDYYDYDEDTVDLGTTPSTTHAHRHHHGDDTSEITSNMLEVTSSNKNDNNIEDNGLQNMDNEKKNNDITALKQTDTSLNEAEEGDEAQQEEEQQVSKTDLVSNKKGTSSLDEEIVESVSQLESVITKTIENTKNLEDVPDIVVDQPDDDLLTEVLQPLNPLEAKETTVKAGDNLNLNTVYENDNELERNFNAAEVIDRPTATTSSSISLNNSSAAAAVTLPGVNAPEIKESLTESTTPFNHLDLSPTTSTHNHFQQQHVSQSYQTVTDNTSFVKKSRFDSTTPTPTTTPAATSFNPPFDSSSTTSTSLLSMFAFTSMPTTTSSVISSTMSSSFDVLKKNELTTDSTLFVNKFNNENYANNKNNDDDVQVTGVDEQQKQDLINEELVHTLTSIITVPGAAAVTTIKTPQQSEHEQHHRQHHQHHQYYNNNNDNSMEMLKTKTTTLTNLPTLTSSSSSLLYNSMLDMLAIATTATVILATTTAPPSSSSSSSSTATSALLTPSLATLTPSSTLDLPIENVFEFNIYGKKDDTTIEPKDNQDLNKFSTATAQITDEVIASISTTSSTTTTSQATTTAAPALPEIISSTTALPDYVEPKMENTAPIIKTRLQKLAVTSGKSFRFNVPEDTFYDNEDLTNLRLDLTDKEGRELKTNSWLQFNAETKEIYGLPLDDAVSKWQYRLTATDSGNDSVTETLEISVQQHRGVRTVNHEINVSVKINEKNMHYIDWQLNLINAIATTLGDKNTSSIVVREIRASPQDPNTATLVYFNETLPTSECPERELNNLVKRLDVSRLTDLVQPILGIKSLTGQLIGPCQKTASVKPKTPTLNIKNAPPVPRNQVDRVVATVGHLLVYKVPSDTFFDPNDNSLTLSLKTKDHKELSPRHWLQFDAKNEEFYGIPKSGDIGSEEYMLVAEDNGGLTATDALVVQVNHAPKRDFSLYSKAYLAIRHEQFNADLQRKFVERIAYLFGDVSTQNIQIRSVTTHHDSDGTIVNFYNTTLFKSHNRCPEEEMEALRNVYFQDYTLRERVKKVLGPELNITNVQVIALATCNAPTDVTHREFVPNKTEEPLLKSTFSEDNLYTIILPAIIIVSMILIASIIACCLHRRRRKSGKMELGDEEERKSFRTKGIPVIFQDELDEKPEIGNKSPIILKDEKPPLLPPSYNTSNMNGDNDVDEYVPPPAVVVGGREARGKSPATPSYRKPPPYVSP